MFEHVCGELRSAVRPDYVDQLRHQFLAMYKMVKTPELGDIIRRV